MDKGGDKLTDLAVFLTPIYCSILVAAILIKDIVKLMKSKSVKRMICTSLEVELLVLALIMLVNII